jgi:hypothetical protein
MRLAGQATIVTSCVAVRLRIPLVRAECVRRGVKVHMAVAFLAFSFSEVNHVMPGVEGCEAGGVGGSSAMGERILP